MEATMTSHEDDLFAQRIAKLLPRAQKLMDSIRIVLNDGHQMECQDVDFYGSTLTNVPYGVDGVLYGIDVRAQRGYGYSAIPKNKLSISLGHHGKRQAYQEPNAGFDPVVMAHRILTLVERGKANDRLSAEREATRDAADKNFLSLMECAATPEDLAKAKHMSFAPSTFNVNGTRVVRLEHAADKVELEVQLTHAQAIQALDFIKKLKNAD